MIAAPNQHHTLFFFRSINKKTLVEVPLQREFSRLGYQDSNLEKQDQNLLCYHYTISQLF